MFVNHQHRLPHQLYLSTPRHHQPQLRYLWLFERKPSKLRPLLHHLLMQKESMFPGFQGFRLHQGQFLEFPLFRQ